MFDKPWDVVYKEQEKLFNYNRNTFELSAALIDTANISDTLLKISDKYLRLPDTLVEKLKHAGISSIKFTKYNSCETNNIKFIPDSPIWESDRFFMLEITYDKCDERSKKGYHWKLKGSEHKHSFGQGNGWFIYSDTDFL